MTEQGRAWFAHQRGRWMRPDAQRFMQPDAARWIRADVARYLAPGTNPADVFLALDRKFNPNQPRIPAGQAGGGRWTDGSYGGGDTTGEALPTVEPAVDDSPADTDPALAFQAQSPGDLRSWLQHLDDLAWTDPRPIPNSEASDVENNLEEVQGRRPPLATWFPGASTEQLVRLDLATSRSATALAEIRRYDGSWEPREPSLRSPGSVEGAIAEAEARARESEVYLDQLRTGIGGNFGPHSIQRAQLDVRN